MNKQLWAAVAAMSAFAIPLQATAVVSQEEAARLKTELTPLGAEKAGNEANTIPAWRGGYTTPIGGDKAGGRRGDPFKDEKPVLSISSKNMDQYADKLTDGTKAMLKKYPGYRLDVYPTHRTAAAPQWVYDNTFKNATRASLNGKLVQGAYGGIPFPIPKAGEEVMWNHMLNWRGTAWQWQGTQYQLTADGKAVMTSDSVVDQQMPYYLPEGNPEQFAKGYGAQWVIRLINVGPPIRAGEAIVGRVNMDGEKDQAWVYLTGQRRVRKLPNPCCDTPTPASAGVMSFDELEVFSGTLSRFDWKLVGKKEMYIPYNGNKLLQPKTDKDVLGSNFVNPDHMRWELHRVWVVDAALKQGSRHQAPKSRYYCDEDTWQCVLADRWDANGALWRVLWAANFVAPDLPGTVRGAMGMNDLLSGVGYVSNLYNAKPAQYTLKPQYQDSVFTPDAMVGEGVR